MDLQTEKLPIFSSTNIVAAQISLKYNVLDFCTLNILHLSIWVKYSILCIHKCECIYADFVLFLHYPFNIQMGPEDKNEVEMSGSSEWETHQNIEKKKFFARKGFSDLTSADPLRIVNLPGTMLPIWNGWVSHER